MILGVFKNSKLILQCCDSNYKQCVISFSKGSVAAKEHLKTVCFGRFLVLIMFVCFLLRL